jgi:DNA-binding HxlR family transcriptional regulator
MRTYGQFCPVAKAAEIFAERWTPLIIRELLMGSRRFNELVIGVPCIPKSMLVQRLRFLEDAGVIERRLDASGKKCEYFLTQAGHELLDIVKGLGEWGQRWVNHDIGPSDLDPKLLIWDMRRRINLERVPDRRVVVQFEFCGDLRGTFWLIIESPEPSVCYHDPGFEVDLLVSVDTLAMHRIWMGQLPIAEAIRQGLLFIEGPTEMAEAFPGWLALSVFAGIPSAEPATSR